MDATPHTRTGRPGRVTQNISLSPEEQRIARELAERKHGGNISRLFQGTFPGYRYGTNYSIPVPWLELWEQGKDWKCLDVWQFEESEAA